MILAKSTQLILLVVFFLITLILVFESQIEIAFILAYGGFVIFLLPILIFLTLVFFVAIRYNWNEVYYTTYFLSLMGIGWCFWLSVKKPLTRAIENVRSDRYAYQHSGGRGIFRTGLETEAAVAIIENDTTALKKIIDKGLDVNAVGSEGPFIIFSARNDATLPIFRILLNHGANPNATDSSGNSFVDVLNNSGLSRKKDLARLSLNKGMNIPEYWFLFQDELFEVFVERSAPLNQKFKVTYYQGNYKGTRISWSPDYMIESNAVNSQVMQNAEWTPVMILASYYSLDRAKKLYDLGADISFRDEHGVGLIEILQGKRVIASNELSNIMEDDVEEIDEFMRKVRQTRSPKQ